MEQINQYTVISLRRSFNENIELWLAESPEGKQYEILTVQKNKAYERLMKRLLVGDVKPLINQTIGGIQTLLEVGVSSANQCNFMVYEELEGFKTLEESPQWANARSILQIAKGLDALKKQNRESFIIDNRTIKVNAKGESVLCFLGLYDLFKQQDLLSRDSLAPNVLEWLTNKTKPRPKAQDDQYALIKSFELVLENQGTSVASSILEKALAAKRMERYAKYHELIALLEQLPVKVPNNEERRGVKVVILQKEQCQELLEDMNRNTWVKLDRERSKKDNAITGRFSTENWNGKFIVDANNHLFIPYFNPEQDRQLIKKQLSFLADFAFSEYPSNYNIVSFFNEKFEKINQLAQLNRTKTNLVRQWKTLPDKEREFIEENAFKAKYKKRAANKENIDFYLVNTSHKTWTKLKELKSNKVELFIDEQRIGKILNYKSKEQVITIGDPYCDIEEIKLEGELVEDVRQETSQFKKQVEACDRFKESDIVNPVICDILATPRETAMPHIPMLYDEDYEAFDADIYNPDLKNDPTQKEAVLEALSYKPVYLIQGPPGTGKTTVIVEQIRQILKQQSNAKILVTSQSNLAVDNVLEKIERINATEEQQLLFMRLASDYSLDRDNIKTAIKPHTFENKLKNWVAQTIQRSEENWQDRFPNSSKHKELQQLYDNFLNNDWERFVKLLSWSGNYLKRLFENANTPKEVQHIFEQELGAEFVALKSLQKDWFSFLAGVTIDDGKNRKRSMLNDGSAEVDFLTAMMREVNIIGATCIHIASGKYSNIDFRFDYVIMDESSKASPPETLVPINMGQNIILIGDHKQLPPVVTREAAVKKKVKEELEDNGLDFSKDFGVSLFEQLVTAFEEDEAKQQFIKMLDIQYRMPKQVGTLISKYFYDSKLNNPKASVLPDYDAAKAHGLSLKVNTSILFISTSNEPNPNDNDNKFKRSNQCNLRKIQAILHTLNESYADNLQKETPFDIGIIAGYRGQVELLKKNIDTTQYNNFMVEPDQSSKEKQSLIDINTVDKFQGAEKDIIIYDVVRSSRGKSNIGFLDDYRRINVAFSRVKRLLIVVGDADYLTKRATLNPNSRFEAFKLQQITQELEANGYVFHSLKEALL